MSSNQPELKSRLEVNFTRLIEETQQIANGSKSKDWKFDKEMPKILILYGSETGTAEEVAERIGRESIKYFFDSSVKAMNDCSVEELAREKLAVFVAATTGQGDDPSNMKMFFKTLWQGRSHKTLLKGLNYCVLGLGDSSYQKFNFAAKRLNKLLHIVGAKQIMNVGLADDQHELGPDFVIDSWLKNLLNHLWKLHPLPEGIEPIKENILPSSKYHIKYVDNFSKDNPSIHNEHFNSIENDVHMSKLTLNLRKTSDDHFQDVRLIEFDVSSANFIHKPGDVLMIQPQNLDEYVNEFINELSLEQDKMFYLIPGKNSKLPSSYILPQPCSIKQCVKYYFDIQSVPKRHFFELLAHFTTDENEKEKFLEFNTPEGQEDLYNYCVRPRRSILEVLADFPNTKHNIPFEYLFNLIPAMRPRAYSIASSFKANPGRIQILMAVVNYNTTLRRPRIGLCSSWLAQLEVGSIVPVWIKSGTVTFPDASDRCPPVVMIGPGTGCAPFRSYIEERIAFGNTENLIMIFGSRGKFKDFFFKDEWEELSSSNRIKLYCAFSRDQEEKIYVQHVMKSSPDVWKMIVNEETQIYFAGNAKRLPIDVYEALQFICQKALSLSSREAEEYMKKNLEKRYQTESWA